MNVNTAEQLFSGYTNIIIFDKASLTEAKSTFNNYLSSGVIKEGTKFEDASWQTTDEYSNVGLHFRFNKKTYEEHYYRLLDIPFNDFILYVKTFLLSTFGKTALRSMQTVLLDLRHIIEANIDDIYGANEDIKIIHPILCEDFFSMLPYANENEEIEKLCDALESYADVHFESYHGNQRILADFDSYFLFDEILKDYWSSTIPLSDRMFYYPLYLWWLLTAVIPLRPREFLLTERNCVGNDKDGAYHLKLRRNKLKGSRQNISYKLSNDYFITEYKIPNYLGQEIEKYKDLTNEFEATDIDTLFVTDYHYQKWEQRKHINSRYLTYVNMNTILRYFYREVIQGIYHIAVVPDPSDKHIREKEITQIHLGDTRHIALISLMQQGGTPIAAMMLAGHANTNTASDYYSNVMSLIECQTYKQFRKVIGGEISYQVCKYAPVKVGEGIHLSDGGTCYSQAYAAEDFSDCLDAVGENGEIGYCPSCSFYRKSGVAFFGSDDIYKRHIEDDCKAIAKAVDIVRQGKGETETIIEAALKLNASSLDYQKYLEEKKSMGE